ncbi:2-octaprenyl-6-methoxyphenol hydroxylase [Achromobacter spanius]|uniref:UbiH/UbiF/VisC/COQ6 family ubiquinone biosynthesis hydroxylase n=1 Tax=Achromobacter spanius TaxID=217203 RepID=UPI000C2CA34B|nr:UbiH/UbiF/VisC/COQ6 family ubiquinone biosynthesis hydroxylase [Achromobacter spanius]AUA54803.1 monooxygenase [Achromobacter spanius]CAB3635672.1 2-octaprenyl-6-methoxyphenol hydroxylase [Achromobacter spanius]SPT39581.1 2-octaprenyl-6-methoxyphenol hydroxylase [Achromobacter denitrificans]VEE57786.1 2-octaprenyl-6-methoxyphenol hydroxylase [Achromobacter spanius]
MTASAFDIAILGAGPVGRVLALMLARVAPDPARIALLAGTAPATPAAAVPASDPRVLAMNHGSRVLLELLQAWPERSADIRNIHVSQRGRLGRTVIQNTDFGVPQLGSVVAYSGLHAKLDGRVAACGVTVLPGPGALIERQDVDGVHIKQGDHTLLCQVAVQSDGAGATDVRRDYDQHAVLTTAHATLPRRGWAWERFTSEGPLALLPHPQTPDAYSVVWCSAPERAKELAALDNAAFSSALSAAFGDRLGRLSSQAPRHVFPLALAARRAQVQGRVAAIGNAAQTLHPVAGQGLNLGLRDAARLAQTLAGWLARPESSPTSLLTEFAQARQVDRAITAGLTDLMPRVFATGLAPVEHACGLALLGMDLASPLRAPLAQHLLQGFRA